MKAKRKAYKYGLWSEYLTIVLLSLKFYRILAWRYKTPFGEIDIIARKNNMLIFIEVKARNNKSLLAHSLTSFQQTRIINAAEFFIRKHRRFSKLGRRFDLIIVHKILWLKHLKQAWW